MKNVNRVQQTVKIRALVAMRLALFCNARRANRPPNCRPMFAIFATDTAALDVTDDYAAVSCRVSVRNACNALSVRIAKQALYCRVHVRRLRIPHTRHGHPGDNMRAL